LLFRAAASVYSLFNEKASKWVNGRKNIFEKLGAAISKDDKVVWMHCASLGEFEQGRPVLEKLKTDYPNYKFLVTFFSPSGYEVQKNYKEANWVFYLPIDGAANARRFLKIVHPSLVIFVKYEFWYYYLNKIKNQKIPLLLISAVFSREMSAFRWMRPLQLKMLSRFEHIFLQNEGSVKLLDQFNLVKNYSIAGDTRFDRVLEIAENFQPIDVIEKFCAGKKVIVAGSTWIEDEAVIRKIAATLINKDIKLIIAPHEINENHLSEIKKLFPDSILYSEFLKDSSSSKGQSTESTTCLIIDNYGMLSKLYHYAYLCFVGGGFTSNGVHNVTEAAVFGKPVISGPYISKYLEAVDLVNKKGGFVVRNADELKKIIEDFIRNENDCYHQSSLASYNYIKVNAGALDKIVNYIQVNRLLTKL
jgi:3-deoxy-D-manno-octulosonic-acid transferase